MTINQIILLLEIYRGIGEVSENSGTYENDLHHLIIKGYVTVDDKITLEGKVIVEAIRTLLNIH